MDNVIRGYNELYNCCIVHRDIKPQNILIKYKEPNLIEIVKISDFGISRILSDKEEKSLSNVAGTLHYMAPEVGANILRAHEYGHEVDIWSIGCVFYQCIMGKVFIVTVSLLSLYYYSIIAIITSLPYHYCLIIHLSKILHEIYCFSFEKKIENLIYRMEMNLRRKGFEFN